MYKRQALNVSFDEALSVAVVTVNTPVTSSACVVYAVPVYYTHLDVYKRQTTFFAPSIASI